MADMAIAWRIGVGTCLVLGLSSVAFAQADPVADFYKGRTITIVVGYTTGGAYDTHARITARHWTRYIPGNPTIVLQNMPGAGSLVSANHGYNVAPKDGTALGTFSRGNAMYPLLEGKTQFDPMKFNWIGSPAKETSLTIAWSGLQPPFKTVDDLRARELVVGATGAGGDSFVMAHMFNATMGTKFRVVSGYPGTNDAMLAIERGEIQGIASVSYGVVKATRPTWIGEGKLDVILQQALEPHPTEFKGVPLPQSFAANAIDRQALDLVLSRQTMAYPVAAPPGVPGERIAALRASFEATMKDREFLAEAAKAGMEIDLVPGERIAEIITKLYASPKEAVDRAASIIAASSKK